MKHVFEMRKAMQTKVLGPELITRLEFSPHPNNPMYVELIKWPSDMSAKEVKQALVEMGLVLYLIDNEGCLVKSDNGDHTVQYGD